MTLRKPKFNICLIVWTTSLPAIDTITFPKQTPQVDGVHLQFGDNITMDENNESVTEELGLLCGDWNGSEEVHIKFLKFHIGETSF
jgi:hypothetical protein